MASLYNQVRHFIEGLILWHKQLPHQENRQQRLHQIS